MIFLRKKKFFRNFEAKKKKKFNGFLKKKKIFLSFLKNSISNFSRNCVKIEYIYMKKKIVNKFFKKINIQKLEIDLLCSKTSVSDEYPQINSTQLSTIEKYLTVGMSLVSHLLSQ